MAIILPNGQIKLNSGKVVQATQGGWFDGQQAWNGTLSQPGQINTQSNQQGAGRQVSNEVIAQTNPANVAYIQQQRQQVATQAPQSAPQPAQPAPQPAQQPQATPTVPGGATAGVTGLNQPTFDPPQFYEQAYASSGIRDIEAGLSAKTNAYNEQVAKIKDNPYLSEATMTGRIAKLDQKFNADKALVQNNIAMVKADIETQLNLQLNKFDIQSDQAKLAWDQFNTLLSAGSLDNASGEDIANLTRATGISSSMIQSAIGISRQKNKPEVEKPNTQVIQVDDGTNVSAVVINQETGEIINKQILSASKPKAPKEPKDLTANEQKASVEASIHSYLSSKQSQNAISPEDLYRRLLAEFPEAFDYITENWTAKQIRIANGEKL